MRDYEDMGPESDFNSDISHESYPDKPKKMLDPEYLANLEMYRQNVKPFY